MRARSRKKQQKTGGYVRSKIGMVVGAIVVIAIGWLIFSGLRFASSLDRYAGVYRTDDRNEVLYRLGHPTGVLGPPEALQGACCFRMNYTPGSTDPKDAMPSGKSESDFLGWTYEPAQDTTVTVNFDSKNHVESIACMTGNKVGCSNLAGVYFDDTEEQVIRKLGRRHARYNLEGVVKTIRYDDLGIEFALTKNRVYMMTLLAKHAPLYEVVLDYAWNTPRQWRMF